MPAAPCVLVGERVDLRRHQQASRVSVASLAYDGVQTQGRSVGRWLATFPTTCGACWRRLQRVNWLHHRATQLHAGAIEALGMQRGEQAAWSSLWSGHPLRACAPPQIASKLKLRVIIDQEIGEVRDRTVATSRWDLRQIAIKPGLCCLSVSNGVSRGDAFAGSALPGVRAHAFWFGGSGGSGG